MPSTPSHPDLRQIVNTIVRHYAPERVLLFGSQGQCYIEPGSDTDLLVIVESGARASTLAADPYGGSLEVNLVFQTPDEVDAALSRRRSVFAHVLRNSPQLYPTGDLPT